MQRSAELKERQLNEKIQQINDQLAQEKEARDMWVEGYEKETKSHSVTSAELL